MNKSQLAEREFFRWALKTDDLRRRCHVCGHYIKPAYGNLIPAFYKCKHCAEVK